MPSQSLMPDAQTGAGDRQRFAPEDVLKQTQIQDVALSPDGELAVYSRRVIDGDRYRTNLWAVPFAGGPERQLTHALANDTEPVFSPNGRSILFLSDREGRKQPWILPLDGGEPWLAADVLGETEQAWWSPDGSRLLLVAGSGEDRLTVGDPEDPTARVIDDFSWRLATKGFRNQLASAWVATLGAVPAVRVSDPRWHVLDARWLPGGQQIAVVADAEPDAGMRRHSERAAVWRLSLDGTSETEQMASLPGGGEAVRPAPVGERVAVLGYDHARQPSWADPHLFVTDGQGLTRLGRDLDRPVACVTTGDLIVRGSKVSCEWLDGDSLVAQVGVGGRSIPYHFRLADGKSMPLVSGEVISAQIAVGGGAIAMVASEGGNATEVYAVESGTMRQLTQNGSAWLTPFRHDPVRHTITHPEGHEFDVWLVEGRDAPEPGPIIVQIHGGPHAAHGPTPWLEMLALVDAGFHVLYPNPRGSGSYGEAFARAEHGNWGEVGGSDVLRAIDWAVDRGLADPRRVGVMGLSYGGYLTAWLAGHHPERFAAAVCENPVSNWVSWYGGSDLQGYTDERFVGIGRLPEDIEAFLEKSPFMRIHHATAPLLLLQSEGDLRCPPEQAETLFTILRSRGKTTKLVRYPNEPHFLAGIGRPDRRVDRMRRIVEWFRAYL